MIHTAIATGPRALSNRRALFATVPREIDLADSITPNQVMERMSNGGFDSGEALLFPKNRHSRY